MMLRSLEHVFCAKKGHWVVILSEHAPDSLVSPTWFCFVGVSEAPPFVISLYPHKGPSDCLASLRRRGLVFLHWFDNHCFLWRFGVNIVSREVARTSMMDEVFSEAVITFLVVPFAPSVPPPFFSLFRPLLLISLDQVRF